MRDIHLGVEADRLAIFARHRGEMRVGVFQRLEHRLGRAPQRRVAAESGIVMRRHEDVGLVELLMLQRLRRDQRIEEIGRERDEGEIDAGRFGEGLPSRNP